MTQGTARRDGTAMAPLVLALRTGLALGVLLGLAEVAWGYHLNRIIPGGNWYVPTEHFASFVGFAVLIDTGLVLFGALLVGVPAAVVAGLFASLRGSPAFRLAVRFAVVGGSVGLLYLYWFSSYIVNQPYTPGRSTFRALTLSSLLAVLFGICWAIERGERRGHPAARRAFLVAAVALLVLAGAGLVSQRGQPSSTLPAVTPAGRDAPPIVLITLDTVRVDYTGTYGHPVIETPNLDALAADGVLFETAVAQAPATTPSHASMMTSRYPAHHGALNGIAMRRDVPTLAEVLRAAGYATGAFVSSTTVRSTDSGLHRGFDRYDDSLVPWSTVFGRDELQQLALFQVVDVLVGTDIPGEVTTRRALAWLRDRPEGPFFAWIHYFDAHLQFDDFYTYPNPYAGRFTDDAPARADREAYGGRIHYVDAQVGQILEELRKQGVYDDAWIVVTSDHGEAWGEKHGDLEDWAHSQHLFDPTQLVPLVVKPPHWTHGGRRVATQVQLVDLAPTLLESVGVGNLPGGSGTSLRGLLNGDASGHPTRAFLQKVAHHASGFAANWKARDNLLGMRTPQFKYVCNQLGEDDELYDLIADPGETRNLASSQPETVERLRAEVLATLKPEDGLEPPPDLDPRLRAKLQALGYLGEDAEPPAETP